MHRSLALGGGNLSPGTLSGLRSGVYDGKIAGLYDLEETLGRGHFAVVKLARHVFTGEKVAVKVIDKSKLDEVSKAHLFQEVRCMKLVQHPNVVRLYEVIDTATKLYLILELGDGGDLYDYIMRHESGLSEKLAQEYFRQIVRAISYCHKLHVVHRDLKPENVVFFEKQGVVKLTDFGFSNKFCPGQKLETSCGSLAYSAPEILLGDSYDAPAVDVWSLGVILYMLVCGQAPFQEANDSETLTMIMDCKYNVPAHISKECKDLISKMLVRAPEKRATLAEIASHPWLAEARGDNQMDIFPLISREQLSEEDHNLIVQKIVNGNIATKEQIQESLDKNEYNHITATYFLLAERKLRSKGQEHVKSRRPEHLSVPQAIPMPNHDMNSSVPNPYFLAVPRTPGDIPQRSRKCSIVQEDEEEEDIPVAGREELTTAHTSLNRRGSRSEGRLNLAVQEKLTDCDSGRKKQETSKEPVKTKAPVPLPRKPVSNKPKVILEGQACDLKPRPYSEATVTTIITDSSTVSLPIITSSALTCQTTPKYKTMPSPTRPQSATNPTQLNEIFEDAATLPSSQTPQRHFVSRNHNRTAYEQQRRSKFHKHRTASCSSSDASDDDSENRKKRAHKLSSSPKPLPGRRDSHDDSSDSQEPGTGAATGNRGRGVAADVVVSSNGNGEQEAGKGTSNGGGGGGGGRKSALGRRHKTSRRSSGETRLRESQSLNRITEVQEDPGHAAIIISSSVVVQSGGVSPKVKGFGARLLQGFATMGNPKSNNKIEKQHLSRKDCVEAKNEESKKSLVAEKDYKKIRLLGKYFQVHKKLCIPLPGLFGRNRLYKAQSCGSLVRDRITLGPECRQRAVSVMRGAGDINQNTAGKVERRSTVVQLNDVCNELTGICAVHLGQASKCCSFC